jgi:hypothetical protein
VLDALAATREIPFRRSYRAYRAGLSRDVVAGSWHALLALGVGAALLVRAFRAVPGRSAALLAVAGVLLVGAAAIHYACVALAKVTVDGETLRVRGPFGTVVVRAAEIAGWHRDGDSAVLTLRRRERRRLRLPRRVRLDDEFFAWLAERAPRAGR